MKVGDLVRMINDPDTWLGHGIVLEIDNSLRCDLHRARVRWFDDWDDELVEWVRIRTMEVISESM